ncbi:MAG: ABC transporter permease, partial [Actinomycetota bacterium]|nr:ABC transporter permease [Actinomycetota bacterium]
MRTLLNLFRLMSIRRLLDRRVRLALTVLGIASGVALYTSISIINATVATTARANIRNLAGAAELEVAAPGESGLLARTVRDVAATPGVRHAVPLLRVSTRLTGETRAAAVVLGVTPSVVELFPRSPDAFGEVTVEGGFTERGLVLSAVLAQELGVDVGDRVELEAGRGRQSLGVSGVVSGGPTGLVNDGRVGVMALESAQATFGREGHVDSVYVVVEPTASLSDVTA